MKISTKNKSKIWDIKLYDNLNKNYVEPRPLHIKGIRTEEFCAISTDGTQLVYCRDGKYQTMKFPIENLEIILDTDKNEIPNKKARE